MSYESLVSDILHTLAVPKAGMLVSPALIREFENPNLTPSARWSVADTLASVAVPAVFEDMVRLLREKGHGKAREMLAVALTRMPASRAVPVLVELLDDDELAAHAALALRKFRAPEAKAKLERLSEHPRALVRREAAKALAAIDSQPKAGPARRSAESAGKGRSSPARSRGASTPPAGQERVLRLSSASTSFDLELVRPFLARLSTLVSGFDATQAEELSRLVGDMEPDDSRIFRMSVRYEGHQVPLHLKVAMEDVDTPTLRFDTTSRLAAEVQRLMKQFLEEHGL